MELEWGLLNFTASQEPTDLLLYKDRSYLLLPSEEEENRFLVHSDKEGVRFYIGSSSMEDFEAFESFFSTQYGVYSSSEKVPWIEEGGSLALINRNLLKRRTFSYFPSFLRNIIFLPVALRELRLQYEVIIRSSHTIRNAKRYNFCTRIKLDYSSRPTEKVTDYLVNEVTRLRKEHKWATSTVRRDRMRFRTDVLEDPFMLCNFIRLPLDEGNA